MLVLQHAEKTKKIKAKIEKETYLLLDSVQTTEP